MKQVLICFLTTIVISLAGQILSYGETLDSIFSRNSIKENIKSKISSKQPLVVHMFVPLCDNEHQGIVPVNKSLGNGMNLQTNLYWGAAYGIKSYFKKTADWKTIESKLNPSANILERVVFQKKFSNGAIVYLVADAYRGDRMKQSMEDYLLAVAGKNSVEMVLANNVKITVSGGADLVILNGHNGLMDMSLPFVADVDSKKKDAAIIACRSHSYFKDHLVASGGFPLLMTTNLMAPEAYVAEALINSWATLAEGSIVREEAAKAYDRFQKCGLNGARRLFKSGW